MYADKLASRHVTVFLAIDPATPGMARPKPQTRSPKPETLSPEAPRCC